MPDTTAAVVEATLATEAAGPFHPGETIRLTVQYKEGTRPPDEVLEGTELRWSAPRGGDLRHRGRDSAQLRTEELATGRYPVELTLVGEDGRARVRARTEVVIELARALLTLEPQRVRPGEAVKATVQGYRPPGGSARSLESGDHVRWHAPEGGTFIVDDEPASTFITSDLGPGEYVVRAEIFREPSSYAKGKGKREQADGQPYLIAEGDAAVTIVAEPGKGSPDDPFNIRIDRSPTRATADEILWDVIDDRTDAIGWDHYIGYMDGILCDDNGNGASPKPQDCFNYGSRLDGYRFVRLATDEYLRNQCGLVPPDPHNGSSWVTSLSESEIRRLRTRYLEELDRHDGSVQVLPYLGIIRRGLSHVPLRPGITLPGDRCYGLSAEAITRPCMLELIWSYWMEQGMLVQTVAAIASRFQNRAGRRMPDPLANFELDPLRSASNLLWGYLQTEHERLSVARRAFEYLHHYGLTLDGQAVPKHRPAETRSRFLESFHTLLHVTARFYKSDDDNTVSADAFPILNALHDLHLVLAEGAHNQYGDLPWTARAEMMTEQWILARPEVREFLRSRPMVPYPENWMGTVDAMRSVQGWGDTSIGHFRLLAVTGEKLLLSVRFGGWSKVDEADSAANWARAWRSKIQSYVHSYRAVTGVDLTLDQAATRLSKDLFEQPSVHLTRRLTPARAGR